VLLFASASESRGSSIKSITSLRSGGYRSDVWHPGYTCVDIASHKAGNNVELFRHERMKDILM